MSVVDDKVARKGALTEHDYCRGGMQVALAYVYGVGKSPKDVHSCKAQAAQRNASGDYAGDTDAKSGRDEGHTSDIDDSL